MKRPLIPLPELSARPLVSVIVPSYNQGEYIADCLDSILGQDYRPIEIAVIDGASTDSTLDVLGRYGATPEVTWISEPDSGVAEAVNKGFELARGELAAIQSADDGYRSGAIARVVRRFLANRDLGLIYGDCVTVDAEGEEIARHQTGPFSVEGFVSKQTVILQPATFFRLALARELGGWDDRFFNADTELWLRMVFRTRVEKIDEFLAWRRVHEHQRDRQRRKIVESYRRMMATSPDLARAPRRLRRAARCGAFLHAARYVEEDRTLLKRYYTWRAVLSYPEVFRTKRLTGTLIPGYFGIHRILSGIKRGVTGR